MNDTDKLLKKLLEESKYPVVIPQQESEKRKWIRSIMNIRQPKPASEELLTLQSNYLQQEQKEKGIVTLSDIPTIKQQYHSDFAYAQKISLWQGDITRLKIDAIVNAANSQLLGCFVPCHSCIDNAIHSAAGIQLRLECYDIMEQRRIQYGKQYQEPTATATITKGYHLPCHSVIHTVGPIIYDKLNDTHRQELYCCYENVLKCCVNNNIKSVAFCCISTGEFHFPNEEAAKIAVEAVTDFLKRYDNRIERIIFNVFKNIDKEIYQKQLKLV